MIENSPSVSTVSGNVRMRRIVPTIAFTMPNRMAIHR